MPGLIGIIWNNRVDEPLLEKMVNSIKHEEWHRVDKYTGPFFSAARVSLGIFDPVPQPIFNEDRTICIFMDGKIYDYQREVDELRRRGHQFTTDTDAEFCLHSYEEYGKGFINSLNGSFVLAIYDLKHREVIIANDRFGYRPLYYAMSGDKLLIASEIKAILKDDAFKRELNDETIADFFAFGKILGNKTFFKGIETLPPASVLTYNGKDISIEQYWDFHYEPDYGLSEEEIVDQLAQSFKNGMDIRMRDNFRYGFPLSGGLDSRAMIAAIDKSQRDRVTAFTFGVPGCDEVKVAQMVAKKAGVNHLVIELDPNELVSYAEKVVYLSDGMGIISVSFIPYAFANAREHVDVVSPGLALEVLVGGILLYRNIMGAKPERQLLEISRRLEVLFSPPMMAKLFTTDHYARIKNMPLNSLVEVLSEIKEEHPGNRIDSFSMRHHVRRLTILGSVIFGNKVEVSYPSLDNGFIEIATKIPPQLRSNYNIYPKFLTKLTPGLTAIPYQKTMVRADAPFIAWRMGMGYQYYKERIKKKIWRLTRGKIYLPNKRSYVNLDEWLRVNDKWRGLVRGLLLNEKACSKAYFNRDYVETLIREHEAGKVNHSQRLAYLATFELFLRDFVAD